MAPTPHQPSTTAILLRALLICLVAITASPGVSAVINTAATAMDIAQAMESFPGSVAGAAWEEYPPCGTPTATSTTPLTFFPTHGPDYGILTSGNADFADDPNSNGYTSADNCGGNVRGNSDYDVVVLRIDFAVCAPSTVSFDYQFLSEEFPEWAGSIYNDAFVAELDSTSWTTNSGIVMTNTPPTFVTHDVGTGGSNPANSAGTTYDEGTPLKTVSVSVAPGTHRLYFSIFDQSDAIYDSAVFLDNLAIPNACPPPPCEEGSPSWPECAPCEQGSPNWPACDPCAPGGTGLGCCNPATQTCCNGLGGVLPGLDAPCGNCSRPLNLLPIDCEVIDIADAQSSAVSPPCTSIDPCAVAFDSRRPADAPAAVRVAPEPVSLRR